MCWMYFTISEKQYKTNEKERHTRYNTRCYKLGWDSDFKRSISVFKKSKKKKMNTKKQMIWHETKQSGNRQQTMRELILSPSWASFLTATKLPCERLRACAPSKQKTTHLIIWKEMEHKKQCEWSGNEKKSKPWTRRQTVLAQYSPS